jgi:hypothetical protein
MRSQGTRIYRNRHAHPVYDDSRAQTGAVCRSRIGRFKVLFFTCRRPKTKNPVTPCNCIEPCPHKALASIPRVDLHPREVQDEDIATFTQLRPGDVLFIDSSHMPRVCADVPCLYLEVLPAIHSGVITHIHDVPFPYNFPYPAEFWVFRSDMADPLE